MTTPNEQASTPSTETEGNKPEETSTEGTPKPDETSTGQTEGKTPAGEGDGTTPNPEDELPDWAKKELKSVRGEAANYRTKLRDAEKKLTDAKTPEEHAAAVEALRVENASLAKSVLMGTVARKYDLPDELAELLKGDDEAALEKHAKTLQKFAVSTSPESLSGGLSPDDGDDGETDPRKLARRTRR